MGFIPHRGHNQPTKRLNLARLPLLTQMNKMIYFLALQNKTNKQKTKTSHPLPSPFLSYSHHPLSSPPFPSPTASLPSYPTSPLMQPAALASAEVACLCPTIIQQCSKGCSSTTCLCVYSGCVYSGCLRDIYSEAVDFCAWTFQLAVMRLCLSVSHLYSCLCLCVHSEVLFFISQVCVCVDVCLQGLSACGHWGGLGCIHI